MTQTLNHIGRLSKGNSGRTTKQLQMHLSHAIFQLSFPTNAFFIYIPYFFVAIQQRLERGKNKHVEVQPQTN